MANPLFKRSNLPYLLVGIVVLGLAMTHAVEHYAKGDEKAEEKKDKPVETAAAPAAPATPLHTPGLFERIWNYFFGSDAPAPAAVTPAATTSTPAPASGSKSGASATH